MVLPLCWLHRVMHCFIRSLFLPNRNSFPCRWLCFPTQFRECSHFRNIMQARLSYFFIFLFQWVLCSESSHWDQMLSNLLDLKTARLWIVNHFLQNIYFLVLDLGLIFKSKGSLWVSNNCCLSCPGLQQLVPRYSSDGWESVVVSVSHLPVCRGFCHCLWHLQWY